jgi:hypothetical protein
VKKGGISMKKLVMFFVAIILLIPFTSIAETVSSKDEAFAFTDGIVFGMTRAEIIMLESDISFSEYDDYIAYAGFKSAGKDAILAYFFDEDDALDKIFVMYTDTHTNANQYIDDFDNIDKALTTKYGAARIDDFYNWSNSSYEDDIEHHGLALSMGYLTILSEWDLENVVIGHLIAGDNFEVTHSLSYTLPDYETSTDTSGV